jgi:hypothetical protein
MFGAFRPEGSLVYEHMFCSPRTSKLTQRARDALALTRAFLLLEDDDPVDWEVGEEEPAAAPHEPEWALAHRWSNRGFSPKASVSLLRSLRGRQTPRRGGQPAAPPQVCLCAKVPNRNISVASHTPTSPLVAAQNQSICRVFVKPGERNAAFYAEPPSRA